MLASAGATAGIADTNADTDKDDDAYADVDQLHYMTIMTLLVLVMNQRIF